MTTASLGPIQEAAALTDLIEQIRAEVRHLTAWRARKLAEARTTPATVAEIAEQVRLSRGRVSQVTGMTEMKRRGRQVEPGGSHEGAAQASHPTPNTTIVAEEAS